MKINEAFKQITQQYDTWWYKDCYVDGQRSVGSYKIYLSFEKTHNFNTFNSTYLVEIIIDNAIYNVVFDIYDLRVDFIFKAQLLESMSLSNCKNAIDKAKKISIDIHSEAQIVDAIAHHLIYQTEAASSTQTYKIDNFPMVFRDAVEMQEGQLIKNAINNVLIKQQKNDLLKTISPVSIKDVGQSPSSHKI